MRTSLSWSTVSPSLASARVGRPAAALRPRMAPRVSVSRRVRFTAGTPYFGGTLHSPRGGARAETLSFGHVGVTVAG